MPGDWAQGSDWKNLRARAVRGW